MKAKDDEDEEWMRVLLPTHSKLWHYHGHTTQLALPYQHQDDQESL